MTDTLAIEFHRRRWDRQGKNHSALTAGNIQERGIAVDCYEELAAEYARRLALQPTDRVLEVGCGSGCLLQRLASRTAAAVGTDFSSGMLQHLDGKEIETHCCEAAELPFSDAAFDKVYLHGVVQYFPDETYVTKVVAEMLRVCKSGGRVLIGDIINGLLAKDYGRARRRAHPPVTRLKQLVIDGVFRPLTQLGKHGKRLDVGPLALSQLFFKQLLDDSPHRWVPLLETVASKPDSFLRYRYDVLIIKDGNDTIRTESWTA
jgi:ubiquinone/menaquinone biosynthesis C-methylase UbiE